MIKKFSLKKDPRNSIFQSFIFKTLNNYIQNQDLYSNISYKELCREIRSKNLISFNYVCKYGRVNLLVRPDKNHK